MKDLYSSSCLLSYVLVHELIEPPDYCCDSVLNNLVRYCGEEQLDVHRLRVAQISTEVFEEPSELLQSVQSRVDRMQALTLT